MTIKLVTFDLWDTILEDEKTVHQEREMNRIHQLRTKINSMEYTVELERLVDSYNRMLNEAESRRKKSNGREVAPMKQLETLLRFLNLPIQPEKLYKDFVGTVLEYPPLIIDGVEETLKCIYDKTPIWLICNTGRTDGKTLREALQRLGLFNYFRGFSFSDEVGWRKPRQEIFLHALKTSGVEAENALHIGDNPVDDYQGATNSGMRALLLDRYNRYGDVYLNRSCIVRNHEELRTHLKERY